MNSQGSRSVSPTGLARTFRACLLLIGVMLVVKGGYVLTIANGILGVGARINYTGRQRLLAERVAAAGYAMSAGVPGAEQQLDRRWLDFEGGWDALQRGNAPKLLAPPSNDETADLQRMGTVERQLAADVRRLRLTGRALEPQVQLAARDVARSADAFVVATDSAVARIAQSQHADVTLLRLVQVGFTVALLTMLGLIMHYAMTPAIRALSAMFREQQRANDQLQHHTDALAASTEELEFQNATLQEQRAALIESQDTLLTQQGTLREQGRLLEEHTRSLARFAGTLDATPDMVLMVSLDGDVVYQNPAASELLPTAQQHRGLHLLRFMEREYARTFRFDVIPQILEHGVWQGEVELRSATGASHAMSLTVIAQRDSYGYPEVFVFLGHDLREERQLRDSLAEREALHRAVIDSLAEGVVVQDREGQIVAWNESAERILGLSGDALARRVSDDALWMATDGDGKPLAGDARPIARARLHAERTDDFHMRITSGQGDVRDLSVNARPMFASDLDDRPGAVATFTDVTAQRALRRETETLAAALGVAADGVAIISAAGSLEFANAAFSAQHGETSDLLVGRSWLAMYGDVEAQQLTEAMQTDVTVRGVWHGEVMARRYPDVAFPQEISMTLLPQGGLVAVVRDISERRAAEDRLRFLSTRDELTGLLNRRGFMDAAEISIAEAQRGGRSCALLYGDLDSFKLINDRFGHATGDAALQAVARLLTETFRSSDLVARLGGDEFTVLVSGVGRDELSRVMERLDEKITMHNAQRAHDPAQAWSLGVSVGVAFAEPGTQQTVDELLRLADAEQYTRKSERKRARAA